MRGDRTQPGGMDLRALSRHQRYWSLAVVVTAVAAAAVASVQSIPGTEYRYDNNGNLHKTQLTCTSGYVLCGDTCVPSDIDHCASCDDRCPTILNGYPTCQALKCGLSCSTGYSWVGGICELQFLSRTIDTSAFAATYSATVRWTTNAPSTTRVRYRAFSRVGAGRDPWTDVTFGTELSTTHVATLADLFHVANYEYVPVGTDAGGSTFYSYLSTFTTPAGAYDVGVISYQDVSTGAATCPGQKDLIRINIDNEDTNNKNDRSGWIGGIGSSSYGTLFPLCRINGQRLKPLITYLNTRFEYAVLALSNTCPDGSVSFWRHFDAEDDGFPFPSNQQQNGSWAVSDTTWPWSGASRTVSYAGISPNYLDSYGNVRLFFCMFRYSATPMAAFPELSQPYGVFAPSDFARGVSKGWVYTDDEDTNTKNGYGSPYPLESQRIVTDTNNTTLYIAQAFCGPGAASSAGQACGGTCLGSIQCDGSCSVATNCGQACGCYGTIKPDGMCSMGPCNPMGGCASGVCCEPGTASCALCKPVRGSCP